jgi:hypothetical protein
MTIISEQTTFPLSSISVSHLRSRTGNDRRHDRAILDFLQLFELELCPGEVSTERLQALWRTEQHGVSRRMAGIRALGVVRVLSGARGRPCYKLEMLPHPLPWRPWYSRQGGLPDEYQQQRRRQPAAERWERLRQMFGLQQPATNPQQETQ